MKKLLSLITIVSIILISSVCLAAPSEYNTKILSTKAGSYKDAHWMLVEVEYTVQDKDTVDSIADDFIKLNTYSARGHKEFISSMTELNYPADLNKLSVGDKIKVTYWTK